MPTRTQTQSTNQATVRKARRFFIAIGFTEVEEYVAPAGESDPNPPGLPFAGESIARLPPGPGVRKAPSKIVQLFPLKRVASR